VILYSLYSRDEHKWTTHFQSFQNNALNNIQQKFQLLSQKQKTFEQVRDHIREALELEDYNYFCFGHFTALLTLWDHILRTPHTVHKTYHQCENRHKHHVQNLHSGAYSIGVNPNRHRTISQCIMSQPELSPRSCRQCSHSVFIINEFAVAPPLLAIDISGHDL